VSARTPFVSDRSKRQPWKVDGFIMGFRAVLDAMPPIDVPPDLKDRIETVLGTTPNRPWCVHRLYEELVATGSPNAREVMLVATRQAADELVYEGRAQREFVSAIGIGVHCEDSLYWPRTSERHHLSDFGPEYESPTILRRLASHFQCHGL
jgi:hypothetical protein